jgi:hypothetical protein
MTGPQKLFLFLKRTLHHTQLSSRITCACLESIYFSSDEKNIAHGLIPDRKKYLSSF